MNEDILVSISVVTFNHKDFIEKCLDGILMQQTSFAFEIILGEDESNDGTREICIEYANKYPDKIRLFLRSRKDVIYINGQATGRFNFIENLKASRGKYIALCDGDDYWTDPLKLQKQVDFLEKNDDYAICFHKVMILNKDKLEPDYNIENRYDCITKFPITSQDLLEQGNFIHTTSVMFRNRLMELPFEFKYSPVGDYFLYIIIGQYGFIKRLDDTMAVYRNHVGIYSILFESQMLKKMIIYNSSILSYLSNSKNRETLLKRQIAIIQGINFDIFLKEMTIKNLSKRFSFKKLLGIIFYKIKMKLYK